MKKLSILVIFLVFSCGIKQPEENSSAPVQSKENVLRGGMTSGGGGNIPAKTIGVKVVSEIIANIPRDMKLFFNTQTDSTPESQIFQVFFQAHPDIFELLQSIEVRDSQDAPCFFENTPTDGSYHSEQGICISSFRLGKALDEVNAYAQIMGLAVHEYAHAIGESEEKAVALQLATMTQLAGASLKAVNHMLKTTNEVLEELDATINTGYLGPYPSLQTNAKQMLTTFSSLPLHQPFAMSVLTKDSVPAYAALMSHLFNFILASESATASAQEKNKKVFGGSDRASCAVMLNAFSTHNAPLTPYTDCEVLRMVDKDGNWTGHNAESIVRLRQAFEHFRLEL